MCSNSKKYYLCFVYQVNLKLNACFMLQAKIMFVSVTLNFAKSFVIDVQMSKKILDVLSQISQLSCYLTVWTWV